MKYLRLFETEAEYSAATLDYPNISYIEATDRVSMIKEDPSLNVCYDVTENIGTYTSTTYDEVYDKASSNWYMLNNLNQYEQYGVYTDNKATYYDGKLAVVNSHEWKYTNGAWVDLGEVSGGETSYEFPDDGTMVGTSFQTTFKIAKSYCCGQYTNFSIQFNEMNGNFTFSYDTYGGYANVMCTYSDYSQGIETQIPYTEDEDYYYFAPDEWTQGVPSSVVVESSNSDSDCQTPFYVIGEGGISYIEEYTEKAAPAKILTFTSKTEADDYQGCVYNGEYANIDGELYIVSNNVWRTTTFTSKNYLRFTAVNNNATIGFVNNDVDNPNMKYSYDGITWFEWDYSNISIPNGWTMYFKGDNSYGFNTSSSTSGSLKFTMSGTVEANGSIQSLLYNDNFEDNLIIPLTYCFNGLFNGCTSLTKAPELPATTLTVECYKAIFQGCTNLTSAPTVLPATTLVQGCYYNMFRNCTSLTTAPQLPALNLVDSSYRNMFSDCANLNYIKMMATDISANFCLSGWVTSVASSGTFVKNSAAQWDVSGNNGIPTGWTVETASS